MKLTIFDREYSSNIPKFMMTSNVVFLWLNVIEIFPVHGIYFEKRVVMFFLIRKVSTCYLFCDCECDVRICSIDTRWRKVIKSAPNPGNGYILPRLAHVNLGRKGNH